MSELITIVESGPVTSVPAPLPSPRVAIEVRVATTGDLVFIDGLQKKASRAVGFMPTKQLEGKIAKGEIVVAWASRPCAAGTGGTPVLRREPAGYLIGCDRYFKHDDVGVIYAINVVPKYTRSLVAASLLKAQFERSAYGCRLYCCWCAQDLGAKRFWESMGFVPLAFRSGSAAKGRTHIFWQKRIRSGDTSTPWWFPAKTDGGALREDRLVLPIPPGLLWSDEMPVMRVPGAPALPRPAQAKIRCDPALIAAARELRDRWLERVNAEGFTPPDAAKYAVHRMVADRREEARISIVQHPTLALPAPLAA